jgi:DNA-binding NarL/FixJ family response regulator
MKAPAPIRVFVVDDHFAVRMGLTALIREQPDMQVVAEAGNGRHAIELFGMHKPDVTLMDLRLVEMNGLEAIIAIRSKFPDAKIIVLTTFDGDEDIFLALQAGARAYLLKDIKKDQFLDAIRAVHAGRTFISPQIADRLAERGQRSSLAPRELEVLREVVNGRSNKEIAVALGLSEETVKGYVKNILHKLDVQDRTQAAIAAVQRGIIHLS